MVMIANSISTTLRGTLDFHDFSLSWAVGYAIMQIILPNYGKVLLTYALGCWTIKVSKQHLYNMGDWIYEQDNNYFG